MFGEEIERLRKAAGLSQVELAAMVGITQSHLSNIETGKSDASGLAAAALYKLCDSLGVPLDHFRRFMPKEVPVPTPKKRAKPKKK